MRKRELDLRLPDGSLDPLAAFKIMAVMTYPRDRKARDRFRHRFVTLKKNPNEKTARTAMNDFSKASIRGRIAGNALITLLQLHEASGKKASLSDKKASLEKAHEHVRQAFLHSGGLGPEGFTGWQRADWKGFLEKLGDGRLHRHYFDRAFEDFRPAAHLWAAFELAAYSGLKDIVSLRDPEAIALLVGGAHDLAERAAKVRLTRRPPEAVLPRPMAWKIELPKELITKGSLNLPPFRNPPENL